MLIKNASSLLLFRGHSELETGLFRALMLLFCPFLPHSMVSNYVLFILHYILFQCRWWMPHTGLPWISIDSLHVHDSTTVVGTYPYPHLFWNLYLGIKDLQTSS